MQLSIEGAGKTFGTMRALDPVQLEIADGEFVAIVGPSGCGKSTLMRMIAGLMPVSEGQVTADGQKVTRPLDALGMVFQQPTLLEWRNALDNVLFQVEMRGMSPAPHRARAMELLDQVGLADFAQAHPHQLSGGMRQRVALARALVHEPKLLLMDEPFGALDALTREQMRVDLEVLWMRRRMTVIFVTHSVDEAILLADRVVVMTARPGKIDQILPVNMPRARGLSARRDRVFLDMEEEITELFLSRGVLHRSAA